MDDSKASEGRAIRERQATFCPPQALQPQRGEREALKRQRDGERAATQTVCQARERKTKTGLEGEEKGEAGLSGLKGAFNALKATQVMKGKEKGAGGPLARP